MLVAVLVACGPAGEGGGAEGSSPDTVDSPSVPPAPTTTILDRYDFSEPAHRFELPGRLDEISGLALTPDGRLFAHDDERGRVHEIDHLTAQVGKNFDLGSGEVLDDFEGIAILGERFFLISSRGFLYEFREGEDEDNVPYRVTRSGVGSDCEVEGLDYDAIADAMLIACKRSAGDGAAMTLYRLPVSGGPVTPIRIDRSALTALGLHEDFQPSALGMTDRGTMLLLSAVTESILEVDRAGQVLGGRVLDRRRHPQPEGLALASDGTLFIADEQNGDDAHVTVYTPQGDSK